MSMIYSEEQQMLVDTAREFLGDRSPVSAQRALRDRKDPLGFEPELWQEMLELGWSAIPFPEALGGLEFGYKGMAAVFEQIGRHLSPTPMLSSVVLCGSLLQHAGNTQQQEEWLTAIISGEKRLALALDEHHHHRPEQISLTAQSGSDGYRLNGEKVMVLDGMQADGWLVAAQLDKAELALFLVTPEQLGLTCQRQSLIDSRNVARLTFTDLVVPEAQRLNTSDSLVQALDEALDLGRLCLAAEMLGACDALFEMTTDYLKTRVQFDVPIGSFQALQHRCAWLYTELALARSTLMAAMAAVDSGSAERAELVSLAKWKVGQMADKVSGEAVQLHGGIGVTDELDVGLYLKRIRVAQALLGDSDYHLARYARLTDKH